MQLPRRGVIVVSGGELKSIRKRYWPQVGSSARIWWDAKFRSVQTDTCWLYYSSTRAIPGFVTLDYVRSGQHTTLRTFRGAVLVLDEIARRRQAVALFAHVGTTAISDRLLRRWGWEPHAQHLSGRHWVKRFYDGYPETSWSRLESLLGKAITPSVSAPSPSLVREGQALGRSGTKAC